MFSFTSAPFALKRLTLALAVGTFLSACSVTTIEPLDPEIVSQQMSLDRDVIDAGKQGLEQPIDVYEAMARALQYNLDGRLKMMEEAMAIGAADVAEFDMLPRMAANAGYTGRTNTQASSSFSVLSRQQSLEPSTSTDLDRRTADLTMVWNVLDFGVAYYSAKQSGDRAQIAAERKRKVTQNTLQEVNAAYWRAVAAERLLGRIDPLMERVRKAQEDSAQIEAMRMRSPVEVLTYQKLLLETLSQLEAQRKSLKEAKIQLAALIGIPPGVPYNIVIPDCSYRIPEITSTMEQFEEHAFSHRPEIMEERFNKRISAYETRKAIARMFPGIEFSVGGHYDSNSYLTNNRWGDYGSQITWNLTNLFSGPANKRYAEAGEQVADARRQALSMAVLTQLYVARANYDETRRQFMNSEKILSLDKKIIDQNRAAMTASRMGDLALIQSELSTLQTTLARDLMYADLQNAFFKVYVSAGSDVTLSDGSEASMEEVAANIENSIFSWEQGGLEEITHTIIPDEYCKATNARLESLGLLPTPPKVLTAEEELAQLAKNIQFDTGSAALRAESEVIVDKVAAILSKHPDVRMMVEAHTDSAGSDAINMPLSDARAKSVMDGLIKRGVAAERLTSKGFGSSKPVESNDTAEGRQANRRVEFSILR
jgi:multidrug efflux system outer membrane protein